MSHVKEMSKSVEMVDAQLPPIEEVVKRAYDVTKDKKYKCELRFSSELVPYSFPRLKNVDDPLGVLKYYAPIVYNVIDVYKIRKVKNSPRNNFKWAKKIKEKIPEKHFIQKGDYDIEIYFEALPFPIDVEAIGNFTTSVDIHMDPERIEDGLNVEDILKYPMVEKINENRGKGYIKRIEPFNSSRDIKEWGEAELDGVSRTLEMKVEVVSNADPVSKYEAEKMLSELEEDIQRIFGIDPTKE